MSAPINTWLADALDEPVRNALQRLAVTEDVQRVAVMPDVHLANGVCIGTVTATCSRIFPEAVGGDIGCGMSAVCFDVDASVVAPATAAANVLAGLYRTIPFIKHISSNDAALANALWAQELSAQGLNNLKQREGRLELGTLGRGNHFIELQRDEAHRLWLMVHSGSRAMGPAIREHHVRDAQRAGGLAWVDAETEQGKAYLQDHDWSRRYAAANRRLMVDRVAALLRELFGAEMDLTTFVDCDHNHVQRETHADGVWWVHRKGALHAAPGRPGVIPGSMNSPSFHVEGRGETSALCSSSHGAGRAMSRHDARRKIPKRQLLAEVNGVWFDHRFADQLREEAPGAYKDIGRVMRAQQPLIKIVRKLEPVLVYKGGG